MGVRIAVLGRRPQFYSFGDSDPKIADADQGRMVRKSTALTERFACRTQIEAESLGVFMTWQGTYLNGVKTRKTEITRVADGGNGIRPACEIPMLAWRLVHLSFVVRPFRLPSQLTSRPLTSSTVPSGQHVATYLKTLPSVSFRAYRRRRVEASGVILACPPEKRAPSCPPITPRLHHNGEAPAPAIDFGPRTQRAEDVIRIVLPVKRRR